MSLGAGVSVTRQSVAPTCRLRLHPPHTPLRGPGSNDAPQRGQTTHLVTAGRRSSGPAKGGRMAAAFAMIHAVAALRPLLNLWRRSPCGSSARLAPPSGGFSYRQGSIPVCVTRLARDPASRVRWGASYPPRAVPVSGASRLARLPTARLFFVWLGRWRALAFTPRLPLTRAPSSSAITLATKGWADGERWLPRLVCR